MTRSLLAAVIMTILLPAVAEAQAVEGYLVGGIAGRSSRYVGELFGAAAGGDFNVTRFTAVEVEASLHLGFHQTVLEIVVAANGTGGARTGV